MKVLCILILYSFISASKEDQCFCGIENLDSRIIGGKKVTEGKYPWMTFLSITYENGHTQCGGSIINDLYILTAAHCADEATEIKVGVGSNYDLSRNKHVNVSSIIIHPNYDKYMKLNDIALLKLTTPLKMSEKVRPVCLPDSRTRTSGTLILAGWGVTELGKVSDVLLETAVTEYDWESCNEDWYSFLTDNQFCAAIIGKDSCGGDSGSPLTTRQRGKVYVVGLVSFGADKCGSARNAVYTKVFNYISWIEQNTKDATYCS